jgi:drug/metabolite transporter (DMT)-like permease
MRPNQLIVLVTLSVIWGSAFMLVKVVLERVDPLTLVAGRLFFGWVVLTVILLATGRRLPMTRRAWLVYVALGIGNNVWPFTLLVWGQERIDSSLAAILTSSMTLSTAILAHFWINERITLDRSFGILIGFVGVAVLIGPDLGDITGSSTLGQLAILLGVVGYSFGTVLARGYLQNADGIETAVGQSFVGSLIMVPLALSVEQPFGIDLSVKHLLAWLGLGLGASGLAYVLYFWLVRHVTATQASIVGYLIPITAVLLGALVLDEHLGPNSFLGMALIIGGVWVVNGGLHSIAERRRDRTPMLGRVE